MRLKVSSAKWRPFCLGLNVLTWLSGFYQGSLLPSEAAWGHRSESTLAQITACCLTTASHYQGHCWLISKVQWYSSKSNLTRYFSRQLLKLALKLTYLKFHPNFPGSKELRIWRYKLGQWVECTPSTTPKERESTFRSFPLQVLFRGSQTQMRPQMNISCRFIE